MSQKSGKCCTLLVEGYHCTSSLYLEVLVRQVDLQVLWVHSFRQRVLQQLLQRVLGLHELGQGVLHRSQLNPPRATLTHKNTTNEADLLTVLYCEVRDRTCERDPKLLSQCGKTFVKVRGSDPSKRR